MKTEAPSSYLHREFLARVTGITLSSTDKLSVDEDKHAELSETDPSIRTPSSIPDIAYHASVPDEDHSSPTQLASPRPYTDVVLDLAVNPIHDMDAPDCMVYFTSSSSFNDFYLIDVAGD